jgi:hypothetical protein
MKIWRPSPKTAFLLTCLALALLVVMYMLENRNGHVFPITWIMFGVVGAYFVQQITYFFKGGD